MDDIETYHINKRESARAYEELQKAKKKEGTTVKANKLKLQKKKTIQVCN
jgi:hypothetical protein